jgi:TetR/AcrR family transcriptional repressor of mexJK operon
MTGLDDHSISKRQQIIAGAETVFTEDGYEGASMSRIAAQAGVSKGTLYNYFAGKSELFAAFVSQKTSSDLPRLFEPIATEGTVDLILHQIGAGLIRLMLSPSSLVLYRIVMAEAGKFPHLAHIFWETGPQNALALMAEWLGQRMKAGQLRQADPRFAAEQFFALCQTPSCTMRRLRIVADLPEPEIERIVDGAVRVFLDSYAARP